LDTNSGKDATDEQKGRIMKNEVILKQP